MIELYYTGASEPFVVQQDIRQSLGGHISSSKIPNSKINNLFRDDSLFGKQKGLNENICIALKNVANVISKLSLYAEISPEFEIYAGFVQPSIDQCGDLFFEKLDSSESEPYYVQFENVTGIANKVSLTTTIEPNTYIGLFLSKRYAPATEGQTCKVIDFEKQTEADKVESVKLFFEWE